MERGNFGTIYLPINPRAQKLYWMDFTNLIGINQIFYKPPEWCRKPQNISQHVLVNWASWWWWESQEFCWITLDQFDSECFTVFCWIITSFVVKNFYTGLWPCGVVDWCWSPMVHSILVGLNNIIAINLNSHRLLWFRAKNHYGWIEGFRVKLSHFRLSSKVPCRA